MSTGSIFQSKAYKNFMAKLYGIGAAIVIMGALFKIMHYPGAEIMLVFGLTTEALIFFFSSFEPLHQEPNWELVYPELATGEAVDPELSASRRGVIGGGGSGVTAELDKMLEEASIDSELIGRLGDGMKALADNANQLKGVTTAAAATDSYVSSLQAASDKVATLSASYEKASAAISGMTSTTEEGQSFGEQMQKVSKNLAALNNVYELQLKGSSSHLEATEKFQSQVTNMMQNLSDSVEDTRLYKENMSMLTKNLTDLNNVYGNMLKAMTIKG
ncbi:MAG TPA: gliding motility protein GldL [Brumimicrobium sp.]|nr:gliding motility protein GldL [Brumimicrobium sp.]